MFQQIMMGFQTVRVKSHFLYLDQNEPLQCCSAEDSYYDAIIKSHLILLKIVILTRTFKAENFQILILKFLKS
jgi:hypothetical protein